MPVTPDSYYYVSCSAIENTSSAVENTKSEGLDASNSTNVKNGPSYKFNEHGTSNERSGSSNETGPLRTPKKTPSFLRRITSTKQKPSSSSSFSHSDVHDATREPITVAIADPMYTAPTTGDSSRTTTSLMNPVSRFRRARNAEKVSKGREGGVERGRARSSKMRDDEWTNRPGSNHSASRSDARAYRSSNDGQWVYLKPGESSGRARTVSEAIRDEGRRRWPPHSYQQPKSPIAKDYYASRPTPKHLSRSGASGNTIPRDYRPSANGGLPSEEDTCSPSRRNFPAADSPRMWRYGIYASPKPSPAQASTTPAGEKQLPKGTVQRTNQTNLTSPVRRIEGWEVQIEPSKSTSQPLAEPTSRFGLFRRRTQQRRAPSSASGSLTLVSEHPLMDRPLPEPPEPPDKAKAQEFARDLTNRMSVLLNLDDVDVRSSIALAALPEDDAATLTSGSDSSRSSGEAAPTATREATQSASVTPEASSVNTPGPSSPFGTFLRNAREMNDAFVCGTVTIWDRLFGKDKSKFDENKDTQKMEEAEGAPEPGRTQPDEPDAAATPRPTDFRGDLTPYSSQSNIEGSHDVMLYSPLIPDADSIVEVAASEVATLYGDGADEARERAYRAELRRRWADGRGVISFDALSSIEPVQEESSGADVDRTPRNGQENVTTVTTEQTRGAEEDTQPKQKEKVVWIPSPTKISVQVLWWGYRIYLPPPVLGVLNSRTIETAKRAALLTSALTWLLDNLPIATLPPALAPATFLLKALVPLLGMIGSFVAWSWKATVTFDRGSGVVLSATWILPIVLVPGTWEDGEVPPPAPIPTLMPQGQTAEHAHGGSAGAVL